MPVTREGLIQKLLEYRRYREAAAIAADARGQRARRLPRGYHAGPTERSPLSAARGAGDRSGDLPPRGRPAGAVGTPARGATRGDPARGSDRAHRPHARGARRADAIHGAAAPAAHSARVDRDLPRDARAASGRGVSSVLQEEPFGEIWIAPAPPPEADVDEEPNGSDDSRRRSSTETGVGPAESAIGGDPGDADPAEQPEEPREGVS